MQASGLRREQEDSQGGRSLSEVFNRAGFSNSLLSRQDFPVVSRTFRKALAKVS